MAHHGFIKPVSRLHKATKPLNHRSCIKTAKAKGVTTSIDLTTVKNYGAKKKRKKYDHLCQYVDVCIGNEEDAETTFGFKSKGTDVSFVDRVGSVIQTPS